MRQRSVTWLRERIKANKEPKVTVVAGAGAALAIARGRPDLVCKCGGLTGDGVQGNDDSFSFCSHSLQRMVYPFTDLRPVYCCYACSYADIASVYEDEDWPPVILLKDGLDDLEGDDGEWNGSSKSNGHGFWSLWRRLRGL